MCENPQALIEDDDKMATLLENNLIFEERQSAFDSALASTVK
jgi:hypothetical protein